MAAPLLLAALLAAPAPQRLSSYEDLFRAARSGREIRTVIEYAKTTITVDGKEEPAPDATGGMTFANWEQFAAGVIRNPLAYLVSSETHLINHPRHGHVYNYVRLRIYSDNKVEITAQYLKPGSFEVLMNQVYRGAISNGRDKNAVHLFASS
jgi:hypothetical protein